MNELNLSRRGFISSLGLFGIAVAISPKNALSIEALDIRKFEKHCNYVAPGKFNAWIVLDGMWQIMCDENKKPFEFDSDWEAQSFINNLDHNYNPSEYKEFYKEYSMRPVKAPKEPTYRSGVFQYHGFSIADAVHIASDRFRTDEIEVFQDFERLTSGRFSEVKTSAGMTAFLLNCENRMEQSVSWDLFLKSARAKARLVSDRDNKLLNELLVQVFCQDDFSSLRARLSVFYKTAELRAKIASKFGIL